MFKWEKAEEMSHRKTTFDPMGLALFHPLPSACVQTARYCFLHGWALQGRSNSGPLALTQIQSVFKLAICLKNHIVLFQITTKKKYYIFKCPLLNQLFFNLKNFRESEKCVYFIGFPEDKRSTKKFLGGLRYHQVNCTCLALWVKNALEIQKAKHVFFIIKKKNMNPSFLILISSINPLTFHYKYFCHILIRKRPGQLVN